MRYQGRVWGDQVRLRSWGLLALTGVLLAGCAGLPQSAMKPTPERPGTSITFRNPDPDKWVKVQPRQASSRTDYFLCRPMACADKAGVSVQTVPSPARNPDRKALDKAAKLLATQARAQDMMADAASEGEVRITGLSSKVTEVRGYPAIVAETRHTALGNSNFTVRGELFIGATLVRVMSHASDRAEAKRHFDAFVTSWDIYDVAPGEEPRASVAPTALDATPAPAADAALPAAATQ